MPVRRRPASSTRACRRGPSARCAASFPGLPSPDGLGGMVSKGSETPGEALKNRGRPNEASQASPARAQAGEAAAEQGAPAVVGGAGLGGEPGEPHQPPRQKPGPIRGKEVLDLGPNCFDLPEAGWGQEADRGWLSLL